MAAEGEFVDGGTLTAQVEDTDLGAESLSGPSERSCELDDGAHLGVGDTTVVPTLGVGLVLAVAVATSGTATHF